ncbi:MAG: phosphocarrier protein HPr [Candidatus Handelsmanbacteria bacterium RIFCSPLOWO2_12_FULL_64_10]|uniref:Phosphocarrier protein HPr n=1 Tax=Handelsmanbacteria sp. (strain RIFCSPLOWO2_12_FULL_64_10) TaxID=1817868 RepID=A0A1F6CBI7_HANXR|nr:MAG: phosphocarrier protein HPr [Candidatus Handelsmanbacteria bacterium RIFCSPLOWO2_12_FULL_64_10]
MVQLTATVKNSLGIHARPAALIVQAASRFRSEILLSKDGMEVNGKSIMGVMMLAAETGAEIVVRAEGEDEEKAARELVRVIESKFD